MKQNIGVVVLVLRDNNSQVLMGKRKNAYQAGNYGLPGGVLELFETLEDCATRELKEEVGVVPTAIEYVGVIKDAQSDKGFDFVHFVFACGEWQGEITTVEPEKCEGWEWLTLDQLPPNIVPAHRAAIRLLRENGATALKKSNYRNIANSEQGEL